MRIDPKHRLGRPRPEASRQFTDREEFIGAFEEYVPRLPLEEHKVLVYYGVGGIGKTSLRKELGKRLDRRHPDVAWATLDLQTADHRTADRALFWLRQELRSKYGARFYSFELAFAEYRKKVQPEVPLEKEHWPLLEDGSLLADLASAAGDIPVVGVVGKVPILAEKVHGVAREWWTSRGKQELRELQNMEPAQIADYLPAFWAADLKDFMRGRRGRPVALFVDTYEALWEGQRTEGRFFFRDEWARELVCHLPEVLWVVCGREKLRWEEVDAGWGSVLEQHLVGSLAEEDARRFLTSCRITREDVQRAIVEGSEGVPYYLDLAVTTHQRIEDREGREPSPSDFAGTPREIQERFLRYLNLAETETLKVLSAARFWDRELFRLLIQRFGTGYPVPALPELCRFSFVQEVQGKDAWTVHPLMRTSLREHQDAHTRQEVHRYLFDHFNGRLEGLESKAMGDPHKTALEEAFHHGKYFMDTQEFSEWFEAVIQPFYDAAQWSFLTRLYEQAVRLVEHRLGPEHPDTATGLSNLADLYRREGRYGEAEPLHERALAICEKSLGFEHPDTAVSLSNLADLHRDQGRYREAEPLYERALTIRKKSLGPEHPDLAVSLSNLARIYRDLGQYGKAEPLHKQALAIFEKSLSPEHRYIARSLNSIADLYQSRGCYEEAKPLYERAIEIYEKCLGLEHPYTAASLNNLGDLYRGQGRYRDAEPLYERALAIREKWLGPEHPYTAVSLSSLTLLYRDQDRYGEAELLCERALRIRERKLGPDHQDTVSTQELLEELRRRRRELDGR